jgi:hypothetical protein
LVWSWVCRAPVSSYTILDLDRHPVALVGRAEHSRRASVAFAAYGGLRMRNQAEAPKPNRFTATPYSFTLKMKDPGDGKAAKAKPWAASMVALDASHRNLGADLRMDPLLGLISS